MTEPMKGRIITTAPAGGITVAKHEGLRVPLKRVRDIAVRIDETVVQGGVWIGGGLTAILSRDDTHHGPLLHLSVSHKHRYPTWDELAAVRYALVPAGVDMMMMLPQASDFVAVHPNCFHLWQTPVEWAIQ